VKKTPWNKKKWKKKGTRGGGRGGGGGGGRDPLDFHTWYKYSR